MFNRKLVVSEVKEAEATAEIRTQVQGTTSYASFAQVYDAFFPRIFNYVSYRISNREETEDLVGLIFERAFTHYAQFDMRKGNLESWLFTIAHNTIINHYRSRKRHPQSELDENLESESALPGEMVLRQEELQRLQQNLAKLSERDRELIALRYGANLSHRQIGQLLKKSEGSVTVALSRAVSRLRRLFEAEE